MSFIIGTILSVLNKKNPYKFSIENKIGKIVCELRISSAFPIEIGDSIYIKDYQIGKNDIHYILSYPIVIVGANKQTFITNMYKFCPKEDKIKIKNFIDEIFKQSLVAKKSLCATMNDISTLYMKKSELERIEYREKYYNKYEFFDKITTNWYNKSIIRQFLLFQFTKNEIETIKDFVCVNKSLSETFLNFLEDPMHLFTINKPKLLDYCQKLEKPDFSEQYEILSQLFKKFKNGENGFPIHIFNKFYENKLDLVSDYMLKIENFLYFKNIYEKERYIAERIKFLHKLDKPIYDQNYIDAKCKDLSPDQKIAIEKTLSTNVSIICGAAGTGKTTILKTLVSILESQGEYVVISAFTGKAVSRLKQVLCRDDPCTLHILLAKGLIKGEQFDTLIIDEASMISSELLYEFLKNFNFSFKIYFIGDDNQLPPIEWGKPFYDMIISEKIIKSELTTCHRFYIDDNSNDINGIIENANGIRKDKNSWRLIERSNFKILTNSSVKCIINMMIDNKISYQDFTILTPYNEPLEKINSIASDLFLPNNQQISEPTGRVWRIGDRVIHLVNNYTSNIMNGDEGIITDFTFKDGQANGVKVAFKSQVIEFPFYNKILDSEEESNKSKDEKEEELSTKHLSRSFALTRHKSQGSEWDYILLFIPSKSEFDSNSFLTRNLFYTGITRARKNVWILKDGPLKLDNIIKNDTKFGNDSLIYLL
jgi:energy-coupling factor transporter ATP-binding protein EcfA2